MREICAVSGKCEGPCKLLWGARCPARFIVDSQGRAVKSFDKRGG